MILVNLITIMIEEEQAYSILYCREKVMAIWIVKKIICHFPSLCLFMLAGLVSHSFPTEGLPGNYRELLLYLVFPCYSDYSYRNPLSEYIKARVLVIKGNRSLNRTSRSLEESQQKSNPERGKRMLGFLFKRIAILSLSKKMILLRLGLLFSVSVSCWLFFHWFLHVMGLVFFSHALVYQFL